MAHDVLAEAGAAATSLDLVAVTVGPGSFTGIRAGLALAHGLALAAGVPVIGVTVGEALADSLPHLGERRLWVAIDSRRARVFLERDDQITAELLEALRHIAVVAVRRLAGELRPLPAQPLYIDPPEAKKPAGGHRPPPSG
jgi:tRNA threonylcarbamoyladenosine biosynthesis protein TsaB